MVEGGLDHIITRGNNRQLIFGSRQEYLNMLSLLKAQKTELPFYERSLGEADYCA